ncbi:MAG: condensation domain-containing protein, partial [bacterium]
MDLDDLDPERFAAALREMIERHEMLRCVVLPEGLQRILPSAPDYKVEVSDFRHLDAASAQAGIAAIRAEMAHKAFTPDQWPLFEFRISRLDERRSRLHVSMDLLIVDGRSFEILFDELMAVYREPGTALPVLDLSFRDYIAALDSLEKTKAFEDSRKYWLERVSTLPPSPELPLTKNPAAVQQAVLERRSARLDAGTWRGLKENCNRFHCTPAGILLAAYAEVLAIWSKNPRFTINLTLFNRLPLHPQSNDILGEFTSVALLEVDNATAGTFAERARLKREQLWRDLDRRYFSGIEVMRELTRMQRVGPKAIMPVIFTSLLNLDESGGTGSWAFRLGKPAYGIVQTPQVYLELIVQEDNGALVIDWDAIEELFPEGLLDDMLAGFQRLLHDLAGGQESWHRTLAENTWRLIPEAQLEMRRQVNATQA